MSGIEIVRGGYAVTGHYVRDCWTVRIRGRPAARCRSLKLAKAFAVSSGAASGKWIRRETKDGKLIKYIDAVAET